MPIDHDALMAHMEERFREEFATPLKALQDAPDGHWIEASEMAFRDAALTVGREGFELVLQARVDANPTAQAATFAPSEPKQAAGIGHTKRLSQHKRGTIDTFKEMKIRIF